MGVAALVLWVLTALAGTYLLVVWLANGGLRRQGTKVTRFPAILVLGHPVLAVLALAAWLAFLVTARTAYAWGSFGVLALVAFLGFVMLTRWLTGEGGKHARGGGQAFPRIAVLAHGVVAIGTFLVVLVATLAAARH